jgi:GMP synthase-like glutamine amidotransferase
MKIGVVSLYTNIKSLKHVVNAVEILRHEPCILDFKKENPNDIIKMIKESDIKYWIFSGSALSVIDRNSPQIPLEILNLKDKKIMLICYSMESILYQLKYPITTRYDLRKEGFYLNIDMSYIKKINETHLFYDIKLPMNAWRNHYAYLSSFHTDNKIKNVADYQNEVMIMFHKNAILLQFHPERSKDGIQLINNWINN